MKLRSGLLFGLILLLPALLWAKDPSHGKKLEPSADAHANNRLNLGKGGYVRVSGSNLYTNGALIVRLGEGTEIHTYTDAFPGFDLKTSQGLFTFEMPLDKTVALGIFDAAGTLHYSSLTGASGSGQAPPAGISPMTLKKLSDEAQLRKSGFTPLPGSPDVFRKTIGGVEVLAILKNGRIHRLVQARTEPLLAGATVRAPSPKAVVERDGPLLLANRWMQFELRAGAHGVQVPGDAIRFFGDLKTSAPPMLNVAPLPQSKDKGGSRFVIAGKNSTATIRGLTTINGQTIANLESRMRPNQDSMVGFLGREEKLLDVMAADNDYVLGKGLTHSDLAAPMHLVRRLAETRLYEGQNIVYNGQRLAITARFTHGTQPSPFDDDTNHGADVVVTNLDRNVSVSFGLLLPYMIERYGFYEGRGTPYRVEPEAIARVFGLVR